MNEGNKIQIQTVNNVNTQKKIKPQIRFHSKKKKTISKNHISNWSYSVIQSNLSDFNNMSTVRFPKWESTVLSELKNVTFTIAEQALPILSFPIDLKYLG